MTVNARTTSRLRRVLKLVTDTPQAPFESLFHFSITTTKVAEGVRCAAVKVTNHASILC